MSSSTYKVNVYIVHVAAFKHRKATIDKLEEILRKDKRFEVSFRFITESDPHAIMESDIRQHVSYEPFKDEKTAPFNMFLKNLHVAQLSNAFKHKKAYELISDEVDVDFNIVLEDDVIFNDTIADNLHQLFENMPADYDVMFLGLPSARDAPSTESHYQKLPDMFKVLPCCDSYIIQKKTATMLNEMYFPVKFTNNVQLSYLLNHLDMVSYLSIPNLFIDGSKLGLYFSTLETNNRLIFNQDYVTIARLLDQKETLSEEDRKALDDAFRDVKLKTNPEFYYLKALYEQKKENYEFAEAIFKYAYDIYESNGAILNNQSTFLRDYMRLYQHLQVGA